MTQSSLRQPSLELSPGPRPLFDRDGEIAVIPCTPPRDNRSSSRNLLSIFSARERSSDSSLSTSTEDLANEVPGWCDNYVHSGSSSSFSTPSSATSGRQSRMGKRRYTPATTSSSESPGSSVSSADNCKLFVMEGITTGLYSCFTAHVSGDTLCTCISDGFFSIIYSHAQRDP